MSAGFSIDGVIPIRAASADEAMKFLSNIVQWDKRFTGQVKAPRCELRYRRGKGGFAVCLAVTPSGKKFDVSVAIKWLSFLEAAWTAVVAVVGLVTLNWQTIVLLYPLAVIILSVGLSSSYKEARALLEELYSISNNIPPR